MVNSIIICKLCTHLKYLPCDIRKVYQLTGKDSLRYVLCRLHKIGNESMAIFRARHNMNRPILGNPILDFPIPGNPTSENPMQLNKDINTDL